MKRIVTIIVMAVILSSCASYIPIPKEEHMYKSVAEVSLSKEQIYKRTLQWISKSFKSAKSVIEYQDMEEGKIIGNGATSFFYLGITEYPVLFTMAVDIKDGKYRVLFDNVRVRYPNTGEKEFTQAEYRYLKEVHQNFENMCESLYAFVNKNSQDDNW